MGVAHGIELGERFEGSLSGLWCDLAGGGIAAHYLGHFHVQQRGSVKGIGRCDPVGHVVPVAAEFVGWVTVLASGDGCALSPASSTGVYTLIAARPDPGTRTCTITATHTTATTATISFTPPTPTPAPEPTGGELAEPGNLGCTWRTPGNERVECTWGAVAGATRGYAVEYELTLNLRGTTRKYASQKTTTRTEFSGGMNKYVAKARYRVAAKGPNGTGPYTEWAAVARPGPAPRNLDVECRADARVYVSWDPVTKASRYTAVITSTPPPAPSVVSLKSTKNLVRSSPNSEPPNRFELDATVGWAYAV